MRKNSPKLSTGNFSRASSTRLSEGVSDSIRVVSKGREPLRERVYSYLRSAIVSGNIPPEERLIEEAIAREQGVSRTPVREALHKLEREGLIEHFPNRGFAVIRETEGHVAEIFEIRSILEGHVLRVACEAATGEFLAELKFLVEEARRCLAQSRIEDVHRFNTLFHDRINRQVLGRERLKGLVRDLREYVLRYRSATLRFPGGAERTIQGHEKIILALETGDRDLCERIMRAHIEEAKIDAIRELIERRVLPVGPLMK